MAINAFQAALLGLFACLASLPGMAGTTVGNYTLGRPLVAGLVVGVILGDVQTGIIVGAAIQLVYIALVTPGGTVSADVRAVSYIGIPLAILAIKAYGLDPSCYWCSCWYSWYRLVLRHRYHEPCMAGYWLARNGEQRVGSY